MKMRLIIIWVLTAFAFGQAETNVPTLSPSVANTTTQSPSTTSPTTATNSSVSPSVSPSEASNSTQPTQAPTANDTAVPTAAPTAAPTTTSEPPSTQPSIHFTEPPTATPSHSPSAAPSTTAPPPHKASIGKIIAKTLGWLILIALSVLLFGAAMSNRYQIYYALRGVWYTMLQMQCTRRIMAKLNACTRWLMAKLNLRSRDGGGTAASGSLNEIIFDNNDLTEGLLMGDT